MIRSTERLFLKWPLFRGVNRAESCAESDVKSLVYKALITSLGLPWRTLARISHYWWV